MIRRNPTTRLMALAAAAALALSGCGGVASQAGDGDALQLRVTTMLPPDGIASDVIDWWAAELEERTDGAVEATVTYGGGLLSGADTLSGLAQGRAEVGLIAPAYFPAEMPLNNVAMVPVPQHDREAHVRSLEDVYQSVDAFAAEFEDNGVVSLGYFPTATMTVSFNSDVESLEDAQGAKLRIPSQPQAVVWDELGVEPVFLPSEEVYESVERGIINGVAYPIDTQVANGITEVATTLAPDVGGSGGSVFAMSKDAFDDLPDDVREVVEELQDEWYDKSIEIAVQYEEQACEDFLADGGRITLWDDAERERIAGLTETLAPAVWKEEAVSAGADAAVADEVWSTFSTAVATYSEESDYPTLEDCAAR